MCVSQDKGFTVWHVIAPQDSDMKLALQTPRCFLEEQTVSQVLELDAAQVVASTMSCAYYIVSLKQGLVVRRITGQGRWCIDLIRVPYYEQRGLRHVFCGVENDNYVLIDFEAGTI